jgi:phosphatidylglycerol:prolipoprotein diacylglycerol transferase
MFAFINWNPNPEFFHIGHYSIHWYGACWAIGLFLAYYIVKRLYKQQKIKDELFYPLFLYCFVSVLVGGRLGHCLFYEPGYFLSSWQHFVEMFLPIRFKEGLGWVYIGYWGLASHGGVIGMLIGLWLYYRRTHLNLWIVLDNVAIAAPATADVYPTWQSHEFRDNRQGDRRSLGRSSSSKWIINRVTRDNCMKPSSTPFSSLSVYTSTASTRTK